MEIIDNSAKYVFFEDLECGDVFKTYDNQIFMKTCDIQAVHYDDYNAVNLENGEFLLENVEATSRKLEKWLNFIKI